MNTPKFIEVHDGAEPLSINVNNIEWFADETISLTDSEVRVVESYDEIKALVTDQKDDDNVKPLSIYELKDMVGEPVWSPMHNRWMLIQCANDQFIRCVGVNDVYRYHDYTAADLTLNPLYRTKILSKVTIYE